ncbi:hypothetical protein HSBAA_02150 [Vreelandella sulfidaeris]|uniref:Flagellar biosynthetic protein FlhB n=1 Tax=Vreelandella sulfidaeris TaxID=115553 RepID=A0A455U2F6_9GAMM|nr:hypothetical protein HSBAA_02150 [Halomonas sulfidaeris]
MAARIREIGEEAGVPRLQAAPLARALYYHVDLEAEVPAELYTAVAEVMAWAYRLKQVAHQGGEMPPTPIICRFPRIWKAPGMAPVVMRRNHERLKSANRSARLGG